jgi:hypothetical protein
MVRILAIRMRIPMIRALAVLLSLTFLTACVTADQNVAARSDKFRNARAAAPPLILGAGY